MPKRIKLWLDDVRDPRDYDKPDFVWIRSAEAAIRILNTGRVAQASLDHDVLDGTGLDVAKFLRDNPRCLPINGVEIHSHTTNVESLAEMRQILEECYRTTIL